MGPPQGRDCARPRPQVLATWRDLEATAKVPRNTLTSINILAELLHSQGKDKEAEPLCKEVLAGFTICVGPEHPFTVSAAENLSAVLRKIGRDDEADEVMGKYNLRRPSPAWRRRPTGPSPRSSR